MPWVNTPGAGPQWVNGPGENAWGQPGGPYTQSQSPLGPNNQGPPPSSNNQQGPPPSSSNPTGPPPNPYGSMYSQGSGFSIGRNPNQGRYVPGAPTGIRGGMNPKIRESMAKNAMIGDLFGGYSQWKAAGSPDLGDQWKRYTSVMYDRTGDYDRLRQQGGLRGLPSREDMLAQLGMGAQQPPPGTDPPQQTGFTKPSSVNDFTPRPPVTRPPPMEPKFGSSAGKMMFGNDVQPYSQRSPNLANALGSHYTIGRR